MEKSLGKFIENSKKAQKKRGKGNSGVEIHRLAVVERKFSRGQGQCFGWFLGNQLAKGFCFEEGENSKDKEKFPLLPLSLH